jgi:hypothetical protein
MSDAAAIVLRSAATMADVNAQKSSSVAHLTIAVSYSSACSSTRAASLGASGSVVSWLRRAL